jgi:uncharacterized protein YbjT (DUF2867 family)
MISFPLHCMVSSHYQGIASVKSNRVCILGGTGFVGRHLTALLAARGIACRVPSRHPQRHAALTLVGQAEEVVRADITDPKQLRRVIRGCDAAINLIGILNERGREDRFQRIHVQFANLLVQACKDCGVQRLLQMSALNASQTEGRVSRYLRSKGEAENHILTLSQGHTPLHVTIFRPSVIFGPGDHFFNRFAQLLQLPGPFPLACPNARFAPVYVGDVAAAYAHALDEKETWRQIYELCGPREFSLQELVRYTARQLGLSKWIIGLPDPLSRLQARLFGLLPGRPFSYDNYLSLRLASICRQNGLAELGITATDIDAVVPQYLAGNNERVRYLVLRRMR